MAGEVKELMQVNRKTKLEIEIGKKVFSFFFLGKKISLLVGFEISLSSR